ncbi:cation:proton antiporter [Roseateles puraquae]|jgi:multicomponent K+:H+ antiporter subunit G|uniref:cation:proton antiporter n=1 Tax=Roseateles puraquae TaxID=431059 RepID=UPI001A638A4A|nr:monovalent cation/H(+) antiporter subunit G [Roseateles sp.]
MIELLVAALLLASGGFVLTAALGLWRLPDFFLRMHAPALASTLAAWLAAAACIVHFSAGEAGLSLQAWAVVILLSITAPVTTLMLARAALFRRRRAGDPLPPPLAAGDSSDEADGRVH